MCLVTRPFPFYLLQELGVPGAIELAAISPVQNKFRYQAFGKIAWDIRQRQHLKKLFPGLPVRRQWAGHGVLLHRVCESGPLAFHMHDKAAVPGAGGFAPLQPVEDKLGDGVLDKITVDGRLLGKNIHGIL